MFKATLLPRVRTDFEAGVRSGVNGTPTLFIDDRLYDGSFDSNSLTDAINQALSATKSWQQSERDRLVRAVTANSPLGHFSMQLLAHSSFHRKVDRQFTAWICNYGFPSWPVDSCAALLNIIAISDGKLAISRDHYVQTPFRFQHL